MSAFETLSELRNAILDGKSAYGSPDSRIAKERVAELDAHLNLMIANGEAPAPKTPAQKAGEERLSSDFQGGDPAARPLSEMLQAGILDRLDRLAALDEKDLAARVTATADSFAEASQGTIHLSAYRRASGDYPSGVEIVDALLSEAEPAILEIAGTHDVHKLKQALRADRPYIETLAARGRALTGYKAAKLKYGVA